MEIRIGTLDTTSPTIDEDIEEIAEFLVSCHEGIAVSLANIIKTKKRERDLESLEEIY